ncbi:hypothetical protein HHI36_003667 [Cryptolaemus montrouzieri]|uniref:Uncharacterized protein n=1 Tax=Cryptolaemus montrouzieri TaxID=559131 RepID=A0ABD2PE21_9CUCU
MLKLMIYFSFNLVLGISAYDVQNIDLLTQNPFSWNGYDSGNTEIDVTAGNFSISVTIKTCDIGNNISLPNTEYLTLKQGGDGSTQEGRIFAHINSAKKVFFYSGPVILQLKTPERLKRKCEVIFEKGDPEDTTLPPITTTEFTPTLGPGVSKYSTVLIAGKSIDDFSRNKSLVTELTTNIADMATAYTTMEGFCLKKPIKPEDVNISVFEQCSSQYPDFENCVRMVYALPVIIDEDCSLWTGYQLTQAHLDIMWSRMADDYLTNGLQAYSAPSTNKVTWWITTTIFSTLCVIGVMIFANMAWKRRDILKRAKATRNVDYIPEVRRVSDMSLSPPYFQSIPPMFDRTQVTNASKSEVRFGADNKGFQYDQLAEGEDETGA